MTTEGYDVVYFGSVDWSHTWQRPQQIASRLARQGRVLYLNPLGLRAPRARDLGRLWGRMTRAGEGAPGPSVRSLRFWLPLPGGGAAARFNGALLHRSADRWMRAAGVQRPVAWIGTPSAAVGAALRGLPARLVVYDALDAVEAFHDDARLRAREEALARAATIVFATSAVLEERLRSINPRTIRLPNGADVSHFSADVGAEPEDVRDLPRPRIGYVGEVAPWIDPSCVGAVAAANPTGSVILVGPVAQGMRRSLAARNVHLLGRRPYAQVPAYLRAFDVCVIPFRITPLTRAVDPVKLYEYLAAGRPVVSTELPEVVAHRAVVTIARAADFAAAVTAIIARGPEPEAEEARRRVARDNSWDRRLEVVVKALREAEAA